MTDDLLAHVGTGAAELRFPCGDLTVEYRCTSAAGETSHRQVFVDGRLVAWRRGPATEPGPRPDVCLRQPAAANEAMLTRTNLGDALMCASRLIVGHGEATWVPPHDEVEVDWGGGLPHYPAVGDLVVQQLVTRTPFGDVATWFRLAGGPVVESGVGVRPGADIVVRRRYGMALRQRAGLVDALDSLVGGSVRGANRKLMFFIGIYDSDECTEARRSLARPSDESLITLGEVLSSPSWAEIAGRLASAVGPGVVPVAPSS